MTDEDPNSAGQIFTPPLPSGIKQKVSAAWADIPAPLKALTGFALTLFLLASVCGVAATCNTGPGTVQKWWLATGWLMALAVVLFAVITAVQAYTNTDDSAVPAALIMNIVIFITSGFVVISFWSAGNGRQWAAGIIWSGACLLLGGFSGFLFGIPRFRSEGKTRLASVAPSSINTPPGAAGNGVQPGQANQQVNVAEPPRASTATNDQSPIEQIADWLTKTIVGVALVNLEKLPKLLTQWASYVSQGVNVFTPARCADSSNCEIATSFALGLIIYFTLVGFLSGYLLTQVFLQKYVNKA